MTRVLLRVYSVALAALPPSLRRDHAAEMRQCARAAVASRGARAFPRLFGDLAASLAREWSLVLKGLPVHGIARDIAYALRLLTRAPGFSLAAIVTLALGIGANAAIFSLADSTLLRPLKVSRPDELHVLRFSSSHPDFLAYQERRDLFTGVAGSAGRGRVNAVVDGRAEFVAAGFVSGNYFDVLGVPPSAGRVFRADDDERNGPGVAVLSERWWRSRFGGDPAAIGRTIHVNNVPVTIVGVAGRDFHGTSMSEPVKVFLPLTHTPRVQTGFFARPGMLTNRGASWIGVIVRLAPGVTPPAAAAAAEGVYRQFHPIRPGTRPEPFTLTPLGQRAIGVGGDTVQRFVILLGAVVGLTLLIACANLANLLLSRASERRREIGVRLAIGAPRARIARQLLIESLVLAAIAGAASVFVASLGLQLLGRFQLPGGIDIDGLGLTVSAPVLLFTTIVACATGLLFGLAPAWRAAQTDVLASLRDGARASAARSGLRSWLVAAQVALSLVLLAGTGLFLRSLSASLDVPLGFRVDGVATASVNLGAARYDMPRAMTYYDEVLTRVKRLPGVTAAAWTSLVPTLGARSMSATFDGYQPAPGEDPHVYNTAVTPEYFDAVGTRLLRGRPFTPTDSASSPLVGIINETAARQYFAGREAVGGRLKVDDEHWIEIVGVAEDAKLRDLDTAPEPFLYSPFTQDPYGDQVNTVHLLVRTTGDEDALLGPLDDTLRAVDRNAPVYDVSTFAWRVRRLVMPQRMGAALFGAFACLALLLSAVGIYAVSSYVARLRIREIGIRIALGADRTRIRQLVLRDGAVPVAAGIAAGLLVSALAGRFASAFLRGVTARDPLTYVSVAVLLGIVAFVSTWLPARRAAATDPIRALRHD